MPAASCDLKLDHAAAVRFGTRCGADFSTAFFVVQQLHQWIGVPPERQFSGGGFSEGVRCQSPQPTNSVQLCTWMDRHLRHTPHTTHHTQHNTQHPKQHNTKKQTLNTTQHTTHNTQHTTQHTTQQTKHRTKVSPHICENENRIHNCVFVCLKK